MNETTSNEDVSQYKHMLEQANAYEEFSRSHEFLGQDSEHRKSPYNRNRGNQPHKWGAPKSPEQYRPDGWLTGGVGKSPLSARRSYHAKSPAGSVGKPTSLRGLPSIDLDSTAHSTTTANTHGSVTTAPELKSPSSHRGRRPDMPPRTIGRYGGTAAGLGYGSNHTQSSSSSLRPVPPPPTSLHYKGSNHSSTSMATPERSPRGRATPERKLPPRAESVSKLQEMSGTKIFSDEKINSNKFVAAFAAFEANNGATIPLSSRTTDDVPTRRSSPTKTMSMQGTLSAGTSPHRFGGSKRMSLVHPSELARRNFTISPMITGDDRFLSSAAPPTPELANLATIISRLKKVSIDPESKRTKKFGDKSDQQAAYLMEIMRQLRKVHRSNKDSTGKESATAETMAYSTLLADLRRNGILGSKTLGPEDVKDLEQIIGRLRAVQSRYPNEHEFPHSDLEEIIRDVENGLDQVARSDNTRSELDSCGRNVQETLEDVIGRLKRVSPRLSNHRDKSETEQVTVALAQLVDRLKERDEKELANVIRRMGVPLGEGKEEENEGLKELRRMLATLDEIDSSDDGGGQRGLAQSQLSSEDAEFLASCIHRLKKANMTPKEAEAVSKIVVQLRKVEVDDTEAESESDELIASLNDIVYPRPKTTVVTRILKSLRRIDMSDKERMDVANLIAKMGNKEGNKFTDELAEVISNLRKAKLNKYEAQQVSGILINLKKTQYPDNEKGKPVWELVTLRKVTTPEKMKAIEGAIKQIKTVRWNLDDTVFEFFVDDIVALGKGEPTEEQACYSELADAISRLKKVQMTPPEAQALSRVLFSLKKTKYPEGKGQDNPNEFAKLRHVTTPDKFLEIEMAAKQIMRVRWNLDCEIFEYLVDDVVGSARQDSEEFQIPFTDEDGAEVASVDTMDISISDYGSDEEPNEEGGKPTTPPSHIPSNPKPRSVPKISPQLSTEPEEEQRKIVFTRKHHWKHNQHHATVIGEKRWRKSEAFATDAVIFSPLSQEQYDRRKAVGASLIASMGDHGIPMEDESHVEEVERKLQENDITLGLVERHASSSKRSALVNKSPKKASTGAVTIVNGPDLPSL